MQFDLYVFPFCLVLFLSFCKLFAYFSVTKMFSAKSYCFTFKIWIGNPNEMYFCLWCKSSNKVFFPMCNSKWLNNIFWKDNFFSTDTCPGGLIKNVLYIFIIKIKKNYKTIIYIYINGSNSAHIFTLLFSCNTVDTSNLLMAA